MTFTSASAGRVETLGFPDQNHSKSKYKCFQESTVLSQWGKWELPGEELLGHTVFIDSNAMALVEGRGLSDKVPIFLN